MLSADHNPENDNTVEELQQLIVEGYVETYVRGGRIHYRPTDAGRELAREQLAQSQGTRNYRQLLEEITNR
jgi:DNA-binding PadR family transcriptional regulator